MTRHKDSRHNRQHSFALVHPASYVFAFFFAKAFMGKKELKKRYRQSTKKSRTASSPLAC